MPSWSWFLIWAVAILGSGAILVATIIVTVRRLIRLVKAAAALVDLGSIATNMPETPADQRCGPAVLMRRAAAIEAWRELTFQRLQRRAVRRDARLARAKRLIAAEVAMPERFRG